MNLLISRALSNNRSGDLEKYRWPENPMFYAVAALLCFFLESFKCLDCFFQIPFHFDGEWLISNTFHKEWRALFYTGPKIVIGIIGGIFLFIFLVSVFHKRWCTVFSEWRKPSVLIVASIIFTPLIVSLLKDITGVYSPVDLLPYGGKFPHIGFLEQFLECGHTSGGRSFPAGHASGGFALMALRYLPTSSYNQRILFYTGLVVGWIMGLYQMGRGEHFISHTLTSMFIAIMIMTYLARKIGIYKGSATGYKFKSC